ncbi:MAG: ABC transporter ATP-binding protein [Fretibacterium sp.]|nr:ABC transporter ATP-binding protein [Fretibacterium sp.]
MPHLKVESLSAHYGRVQALDNVSLEAEKGSIVALIGANGAGKTTLMMSLSGVLTPSTGTIEFEGKRLERSSPEQIVSWGLSHCPEGRRVWPKMTVLENLEMGAISVTDKSKVAERLEWSFSTFPILAERRRQMAGSLSGGEQQMLAIARALMPSPRLLMLDEPSLGLAPIMVEKVVDIVREIRSTGTTVLLVEQNAFMALSLSDYTYVLETGKIRLFGPSAELMENDEVRQAYLGV